MLSSAVLLAINPDHPEPRKIQRAVAALNAGELIAYPTDTVYGLGCDLSNKAALDRLYQLKNMPRSQPLALICVDLSDIARYVIVDNASYRLLRRLLPGPYTFILPATREVPKTIAPKRTQVGIRVPAHEVPRAIAKELGRPLLSTTAGVQGGEPLQWPEEIAAQFPKLSLVLDGGPCGLVPTTVIDLTQQPPVLVRQGAGAVDFAVETPGEVPGYGRAD
jgi:tRNA threonylcarbamoyl adenosine modification protein (Sua5/YciO/YrdC/YwlC family)